MPLPVRGCTTWRGLVLVSSNRIPDACSAQLLVPGPHVTSVKVEAADGTEMQAGPAPLAYTCPTGGSEGPSVALKATRTRQSPMAMGQHIWE